MYSVFLISIVYNKLLINNISRYYVRSCLHTLYYTAQHIVCILRHKNEIIFVIKNN